MKKFLVAAAAALAVAAIASVALAAIPTAKVKTVGKKYVISGTATLAKGSNVVAVEIIKGGTTVASNNKYAPPTAKNGGKWRVTAPKSELPAGKYLLEWVEVIPGSKPHYLKFGFKTP